MSEDPRDSERELRVVGAEPGTRSEAVEIGIQAQERSWEFFVRASEPILETCREAQLACALAPAMASGLGADLEGPISRRLLSSLPTIVDIHAAWNEKLSPVSFPKLVPVAQRRTSPGRVGAFFSGGADSFHSFLANRDEITDLIFIHGFDLALDRKEIWQAAAASVEAVASSFGVGVVQVETNIRPFLRNFCPWTLTGHGLALATVGHLLAPAFERIYIASAFHYRDLFPWGSHPLLDPLWSSELLEFVHYGCATSRVEKVRLIAESDVALGNLRVCHWKEGVPFEPGGPLTCGRCEKCLRTMISLELAGKLSQCRSFGRPLDVARVRKLSVESRNRDFFEENLEALRRQGARPDLQRALQRCLRRPAWLDRARRCLGRSFGTRVA